MNNFYPKWKSSLLIFGRKKWFLWETEDLKIADFILFLGFTSSPLGLVKTEDFFEAKFGKTFVKMTDFVVNV